MPARRSRYDILEGILRRCRAGERLTSIGTKCRLNRGIAEDYLEVLMSAGLLENEEGRYWTTEKGRAWLAHFSACKELFLQER